MQDPRAGDAGDEAGHCRRKRTANQFSSLASKQRHFALVPKGNGIRGSMFDLQGRLLITNTTISGLVGSLGLATEQCLPSLVLARIEAEQGIRRIDNLVGRDQSFNVGIFVGARKMHGKRWRRENFLEVATALHAKEFGPYLCGSLRARTACLLREVSCRRIPVVFEPDVRSSRLVTAVPCTWLCNIGEDNRYLSTKQF